MNKPSVADKETLIREIQSCDNPYLLYQISQLLKRKKQLQPLEELVIDFPLLTQESPPRDLRVITGQKAPLHPLLAKYETLVTPILYLIGLGMLVLAAALVNLMSHEGENIAVALFQSKVAVMYLIGWFFFVVDIILVWILAKKSAIKLHKSDWARKLLVLMFPPLRIGAPHLMDPDTL
jgi:voltage-gated potassium channel